MRKTHSILIVITAGALALHCSPGTGNPDGTGDTGTPDVTMNMDTGDDAPPGETGPGDTGPTDAPAGDGAAPASCASPVTPIAPTCWRRDMTSPLPNFRAMPDPAARSIQIRYEMFSPTSCAVLDGCVRAEGRRRVMRFDFYVHNAGGDFRLGPPTGRSAIPELFTQNMCNRTYELTGWGEYDLLNMDGSCAGYGHKQSFCLIDLAMGPGAIPLGAGERYDCSTNQGIHPGWIDIYSRSLQCQFIDITDVPAGDYMLRGRVNTEHRVCETDYTDNSFEIPVTIPPG